MHLGNHLQLRGNDGPAEKNGGRFPGRSTACGGKSMRGGGIHGEDPVGNHLQLWGKMDMLKRTGKIPREVHRMQWEVQGEG